MADGVAETEKRTAVDSEIEVEQQPIELELSEQEKTSALKELMASAQNEIAEIETELAQEVAYRNRLYVVREMSADRETPEGLAAMDKLLRDAIEKVRRIEKDLEMQREFYLRCDVKLFHLEHR